jgi:alkaline phosphatase D
LLSHVAASTARWKVIATSVAFTSMVLDLTPPALGVPAPFNQRFYLNVDQWDGFPQQRDGLLRQALGNGPGVVFLSGDIHAGFATVHPGAGATHAEFTTPAVSSTPFRTLLQRAADGDPLLRPIAGALIPALDLLLQAGNPRIAYTQTTRHGVSVAQFGPDEMNVRMFEFDAARADSRGYAGPGAPDAVVELRWNGSELTRVP